MSCWTLWQRMPPRYQLTMRDTRADDHDTAQGTGTGSGSRASSASPRSPRLRTPRGTRRVGSARARLSGEGAMLTTGVLPEDYPSDAEVGPQSPVLPPRSSPYISNMKNQMRINSARRKMDEGTFTATSTSTMSYTPKARATTAPAFPITKPANTDEYHRITSPRPDGGSSPRHQQTGSPRHQYGQQQQQQRGFSGRRSPKRPSSGYARVDTRRVAISTITPFGEMRDMRAEGQSPTMHQRLSPRQQDCVIGDYQVAALYLDKGKVTFFRKTRPDVTQSVYSAMSPYQVSKDDGSYLAHLRKAYLSGVRDLPKMARKEPDIEKHTTIRERMDYDQKVGRILDYYAKVDISKQVHAPRPPEAQLSLQSSFPLAGQQGFRTISSRRRVPRATEVVKSQMSLPSDGSEFPSPRGPRGYTSPRDADFLQLQARDPDGFVRINAQARLHDRSHFYLRTPAGAGPAPAGQQGEDVQKSGSCACGMCRLEMEVALMAQLHRDLGMSVDAFAAAQIRASLEESNAVNMHQSHAVHEQMAAPDGVSEEDTCPARPNSVSDSRRRSNMSGGQLAVNPLGSAADSNQSLTGVTDGTNEISTSTQTSSVGEANSLTVTLPAIEETNETSPASNREASTSTIETASDSKAEESTNPSVQDETTTLNKSETVPGEMHQLTTELESESAKDGVSPDEDPQLNKDLETGGKTEHPLSSATAANVEQPSCPDGDLAPDQRSESPDAQRETRHTDLNPVADVNEAGNNQSSTEVQPDTSASHFSDNTKEDHPKTSTSVEDKVLLENAGNAPTTDDQCPHKVLLENAGNAPTTDDQCPHKVLLENAGNAPTTDDQCPHKVLLENAGNAPTTDDQCPHKVLLENAGNAPTTDDQCPHKVLLENAGNAPTTDDQCPHKVLLENAGNAPTTDDQCPHKVLLENAGNAPTTDDQCPQGLEVPLVSESQTSHLIVEAKEGSLVQDSNMTAVREELTTDNETTEKGDGSAPPHGVVNLVSNTKEMMPSKDDDKNDVENKEGVSEEEEV